MCTRQLNFVVRHTCSLVIGTLKSTSSLFRNKKTTTSKIQTQTSNLKKNWKTDYPCISLSLLQLIYCHVARLFDFTSCLCKQRLLEFNPRRSEGFGGEVFWRVAAETRVLQPKLLSERFIFVDFVRSQCLRLRLVYSGNLVGALTLTVLTSKYLIKQI